MHIEHIHRCSPCFWEFPTARLDEQRLPLRPKPNPKWYRPESCYGCYGTGWDWAVISLARLRSVHLGPSTGPGHSTVVHIQQWAITSDLCICKIVKSCKVQSSLIGVHQNDTIFQTLHLHHLNMRSYPCLCLQFSQGERKKKQAWHGKIYRDMPSCRSRTSQTSSHCRPCHSALRTCSAT